MHTRLLFTLFTLLALVAGACGTDVTVDSGDPATALAAAGQATLDAGSAAMVMEVTMSGLPGPTGETQSFTFTSEGEFDFEAQRGNMTMELGELFGDVPGFEGHDTTIEVIVDGTLIYMRSALVTAMLRVDTPWLSLDRDALGEDTGVDLGQMQQLGRQSDPSLFLAFLQGASDDVRVAGEEDVRGVATTRYEATVDLRRASEEADAVTDRETFEAFIEQLGSTAIPMTAWIDDDGLLRRMRFDASLGAAAGGATMTMTLELFDYGRQVDVSPPPADQVTDFAELQARLGG